MPELTFFKRDAGHFESLFNAAESAMQQRNIELAGQEIAAYENALNTFNEKLRITMDTLCELKNDFNSVNQLLRTASEEEIDSLNNTKLQLKADIKFLQQNLRESNPQQFANEHEKQLEQLKTRYQVIRHNPIRP